MTKSKFIEKGRKKKDYVKHFVCKVEERKLNYLKRQEKLLFFFGIKSDYS